jgi:hypothetical protein
MYLLQEIMNCRKLNNGEYCCDESTNLRLYDPDTNRTVVYGLQMGENFFKKVLGVDLMGGNLLLATPYSMMDWKALDYIDIVECNNPTNKDFFNHCSRPYSWLSFSRVTTQKCTFLFEDRSLTLYNCGAVIAITDSVYKTDTYTIYGFLKETLFDYFPELLNSRDEEIYIYTKPEKKPSQCFKITIDKKLYTFLIKEKIASKK